MKGFLAATLVGAAGLVALGHAIDGMRPLQQAPLHAGLQLASLGGATIGMALFRRLAHPDAGAPLLALGALLSWRLAYFPIMVFSGHVASLGEWLLLGLGAPVVVYPVFLISVATIQAIGSAAAGVLLAPPVGWLRFAVAPAFLVAASVSFNQVSDLTLWPDSVRRLDGPVPLMQAEAGNPYLPAFSGPGYWPNQRVVLLAAGLTYETIPPSPWATSVKAVLEGLFRARPFGSTRDRVVEHYLAYHAAHSQIGCRKLSECPPDAP